MRVQLATAGVINNCSVSFSIAVKLRLFSLSIFALVTLPETWLKRHDEDSLEIY